MESFLALLCQGLVQRGVECEVVVASENGMDSEEELNGVRVRRMRPLGTFRSLPLCPGALRVLRDRQADIINLHHPNPLADVSYLFARFKGRLVVTYHSDIVSQTWLEYAHRAFLFRTLTHAHTIVATSPDYPKSSPILRKFINKIRIIPLSCELNSYQSVRIPEQQNKTEPQYCFVGRLVSYKGLPVLLEALQYAPGHLWIAGTGPLEKRLRRQAIEGKLEDRVKFLGNISDEEKFRRLAACDVFVLPSISRAEAFGIVLLEAMAVSKPVVVSDLSTGVRMLVQNGVNGYRFPPGNAKELAKILRRLANDREERQRLGEAGRQIVKQFTVDRMVDRYCELYQELLR